MTRIAIFLLAVSALFVANAAASPSLISPGQTIEAGWDATVETPPKWDTWSGVAWTPNTTTSYGGLTYALNNDKARDGWRLRLEGGSGTYYYTSTRTDGVRAFPVDFQGVSTFASGLVGYQWQSGPWTTKLFAGVAYQHHQVGPVDVDNPVMGEKWGGKISAEGWRNVGEASFATYDASFATPFSSYSGQLRYGQSIMEDLWLGIEAGAYGNQELNAARLGVFGRWRTDYGTLWVTGGVSGDYDDPSTPYGSALLVKSF